MPFSFEEVESWFEPKEAEAGPLTKGVREAYKESLSALKKKTTEPFARPFYHMAKNRAVKRLVEEGMKPPRTFSATTYESYKPSGVYFAPSLSEAMYLKPFGAGKTYTLDQIANAWESQRTMGGNEAVRGLFKGRSDKVLYTTAKELNQTYLDFLHKSTKSSPITNPKEFDQLQKQWDRSLSRKYDAVLLSDVDDVKGMHELIVTNPKTVKLFWKGLKWPMGAAGNTISSNILSEEAQAETLQDRIQTRGPVKEIGMTPFSTPTPKVIDMVPKGVGIKEIPMLPDPNRTPSSEPGSSIVDKVLPIAGDLALFGLSGAAAGALGLTGIGLPIAAGAIYTAASTARRLLAQEPEVPTFSEVVAGQELPMSGITRPFVETAENILFFGGGKEAFDLAKKAAKASGKVLKMEPLKPVQEAFWENLIVKPTHIKVPYTDKTIQEIFQPAIERIRERMPKVGGTFRESRAQTALAKDVLAGVARESEKLLPTEKTYFMKLIGGEPLSNIPKGPGKDLAVRTFKDIQGVTKDPYRTELYKGLGKLIMKPIEEVETKITPSTVKRWFSTFEKGLTGKVKVKPKEIHRVLDEMIKHPRVPEEVKSYAKDLYNLSAQMPLDVAKSLSHAENEYLIGKLLKYPGLVSSKLKPGYVESKHPSLKGLFIDRDIELELEAQRKIPEYASKLYNKYFMSPWKTNKVVLRPATHFRNMLGNLILNDWGGMSAFDPRSYITYMKAFNELKNKGPIYQEYRKIMGEAGRWGKEEMDQLVPALRYGSNMFEKALNVYDTIASPMRNIYGAEETWFKLGKYMHNIERGMGKTEAAMDAMRWTFNYGEVAPVIAKMRTAWWGAPFITWQSKVFPLMVETAVKHPLRFSKWFGLVWYLQGHALETIGLSEGEWETIKDKMPDYIKGGWWLLMPWRDERQQLKMLNLTWLLPGLGDFSEYYQRFTDNPLTALAQNPMVNTLAALQNKKTYTGMPLYYDWEHTPTKAAKALGFMWKMWSPAVAPGNIDWNTLWDAINERPDSLTPIEAVGAQFGFKLKSYNPSAANVRRETVRRVHESEITSQMRRELRRATSAQEVSTIIDKYRQLQIEVHHAP